jgi:hypothetical protein
MPTPFPGGVRQSDAQLQFRWGRCVLAGLEKLASPEPQTCFHAMGVLQELAGSAFDDCLGFAYSRLADTCFRKP